MAATIADINTVTMDLGDPKLSDEDSGGGVRLFTLLRAFLGDLDKVRGEMICWRSVGDPLEIRWRSWAELAYGCVCVCALGCWAQRTESDFVGDNAKSWNLVPACSCL